MAEEFTCSGGRCVEDALVLGVVHEGAVRFVTRRSWRIRAETRDDIEAPLPACRIRPTCRWLAQSGRAACHRFRLVITETIELVPAS